jgi:hypothetical protein
VTRTERQSVNQVVLTWRRFRPNPRVRHLMQALCLQRYLICDADVAPNNGCERPPGRPQENRDPRVTFLAFFQEKASSAVPTAHDVHAPASTRTVRTAASLRAIAPSHPGAACLQMAREPARAPRRAPPCDANADTAIESIDLRIDRAPNSPSEAFVFQA